MSESDGDRVELGLITGVLPRGIFRIRCDDGASLDASLDSVASNQVAKLVPGVSVRIKRYSKDPRRAKIVGGIR